MRFYELVLLVRQDSDVNRVVDSLLNFADSQALKILKRESWGVRKLAYPIVNEKHAHYVFLGLETSTEHVKEIESRIKSNTSDFLRHMLVRASEISDKRSPILDSDLETRFVEKPRFGSA